MSSETSFVTVQKAAHLRSGRLPHQRKHVTFFKHEGDGISGVQSFNDIEPDSFVAGTIRSVATLNNMREHISASSYQTKIDEIIADCCNEEANGDYLIQVTDNEADFQSRIDSGTYFPVLWTDNPEDPNYTSLGSQALANHEISFLPVKASKTIDVWANRPIPENSALETTLKECAAVRVGRGQSVLAQFSDALRPALQAKSKSAKKWTLTRERDSEKHATRKAHPSWYPAILPDGSICLSRTQALRYNASIADTTGSQAVVFKSKSIGQSLVQQETVLDDWELAAE